MKEKYKKFLGEAKNTVEHWKHACEEYKDEIICINAENARLKAEVKALQDALSDKALEIEDLIKDGCGASGSIRIEENHGD